MTLSGLRATVLDKLRKKGFLTCPVCGESILGEIVCAVDLALLAAAKEVEKEIEEIYTEVLYEITRSQCGTGEWANNSDEFQRGFEVGVMVLQRQTRKRLVVLPEKEGKKK